MFQPAINCFLIHVLLSTNTWWLCIIAFKVGAVVVGYMEFILTSRSFSAPVQLLTTCEHGELELICPQSKVIQVKSVFYGRKERVTCTPHWSIPNWKSECYSATALSIVSTMLVPLSLANILI